MNDYYCFLSTPINDFEETPTTTNNPNNYQQPQQLPTANMSTTTSSQTERNRARRHAARDRRAFKREVEGVAALMAFAQGTEVNRAILHRAGDIIYERRLEAERLEAERLEAERLEAERLEAEAEERRLHNRARRHAARDRRAASRLAEARLEELADAVVADEQNEASVEAAITAAHNYLSDGFYREFNMTLLPADLLLAVIIKQVMATRE